MYCPCSAGVGRTGTFIALFAQLERMEEEKDLDIFGFVRGMRYKRNSMVQTEVRSHHRIANYYKSPL